MGGSFGGTERQGRWGARRSPRRECLLTKVSVNIDTNPTASLTGPPPDPLPDPFPDI
ncbi:hypothetical protein GCM10017674_27730 [Streptomyces gardneri]|uniref:Uncharacterized protein n=1 Tax=Streptomyces gardneri TaxID=66892 RepID=A0A4Y3RMY1_9ACTN|nr:hypothetical protein SGA01_37080 [Streptomyces gardneri]GHG95812.1 hypothetical protein GCM10017674_27730 [Streptomyces gardneri]